MYDLGVFPHFIFELGKHPDINPVVRLDAFEGNAEGRFNAAVGDPPVVKPDASTAPDCKKPLLVLTILPLLAAVQGFKVLIFLYCNASAERRSAEGVPTFGSGAPAFRTRGTPNQAGSYSGATVAVGRTRLF
jgi:hypothetical protein